MAEKTKTIKLKHLIIFEGKEIKEVEWHNLKGLDFWLNQEISELLKWIKEAGTVFSEGDISF